MDQKPETANPATSTSPTSNAASTASTSAAKKPDAETSEVMTEVAQKIAASQNVLIALSSDPSVDELATAIGLSLFLDRLGKRATAIYSGTTPNVLEFLKPDEVFETSADTLQDFVIALNKEKADHLRYKLDGDFVKIFITPYKTKITQDDLNFSYGDFNVDLVLALDVANGVDLDSALREHGRIMHDAVIVNITTGNPGKLGEIEWSDKNASSVAEMISRLLFTVTSENLEDAEATAFLTGIVAATNRFSNAKTSPDTMAMASELMRSGANQQLVSENITPEVDNELLSRLKQEGATSEQKPTEPIEPASPSSEEPAKMQLSSSKSEENEANATLEPELTSETEPKPAAEPEVETEPQTTPEPEPEPKVELKTEPELKSEPEPTSEPTSEELTLQPEPKVELKPEPPTESESVTETTETIANITPDSTSKISLTEASTSETAASDTETSALLDDLKAAEASLSGADAETVPKGSPKSSDSGLLPNEPTPDGNDEGLLSSEAPTPEDEGFLKSAPEKTIQPPADSEFTPPSAGNYGEILESTLASVGATDPTPTQPIISPSEEPTPTPTPTQTLESLPANPAEAAAPTVASNPEINGVPEINYAPPAGADLLPPPPAPPIDLTTSPMNMPPADVTISTPPAEAAAPEPAPNPTPNPTPSPAPDAFKIPNM